MKAFIVGGAGFVGQHLTNHLKNDLKWLVSVSKMPFEQIESSGVSVYDLDILSRDDITNILEEIRPDYVFHLAAQSSVSVSWKNPALTIDVNVKGAVNLLEAIRGLDYNPRVLLVGSGEEYGRVIDGEIPLDEQNRLRPGNIYAATKACQNMLGKIYSDAYDMDIMMVRAFNHIGPGQGPSFVVSDFCRQTAEIEAGKMKPVIRVGNLSAKRDFTDVRDVVKAYALLMERGEKGETYNVGSGNAMEIGSVLDKILELSKVKIKVETDRDKLRPVDVPVIEADIGKLMARTGWTPEIGLDDTIAETLEYWRKNTALQ